MRRITATLGLLFAIGMVLAQAPAPALTLHRDTFDGPAVRFQPGAATIPLREEAHAITQQFARSAPSSEYFKLTAGESVRELNPYAYYVYATPRAPIADDTSAGLAVRASRPGVQLWARVVLPHEHDPANPAGPLTVLVPGDKYALAGARWQSLEVRMFPKLVSDERQRLRVKLNRDIDIGGAYVDQLVLNVYAGPGPIEIWVDDLTIGPVIANAEPARTEARSKAAPAPPPPGVRPIGPPAVEFQRDQLRVGGRPVLMRGIRHTDTPIKTLREAGINTLICPDGLSPTVAEEAARLGMWLMPGVTGDAESARAAGDAVLAWHLGEWRTTDELDAVTRSAAALRAVDAQRPIACDVREGFWAYSRHIDLVGAHRWPLFTTLEMSRYRDWLVQRRNLCRPNTYLWSWVQTHMPEWYLDVVRPARTPAGFAGPVGPHPEQIRVLTYIALAAGYRGIAWSSDRALSDVQQGRDRLLQIALLNQELTMLEPVLVAAVNAPSWIDTSMPQVKAAVFRGERGLLVVPIYLGAGTQFVPEQGASSRLVFTVPQVPIGTLAWDVTPGEVHQLAIERVVGGMQVTLPEFDSTASIVFTADTSPTGMLVRWQDLVRRMAPTAAQWSYDLANVTLTKTETVQAELAKLNVALPDSSLLLKSAREHLQAARSAWEAHDYRTSYREAQRAQRPLRVLERAQWINLIQGLDTPAASPFAVSYYSLPQHVAFIRQVTAASPGANLLTDGDFERGGDVPTGWQIVRNTLDEVDMVAKLQSDAASGKQALYLEAKAKIPPTEPGQNPPPPPVALERLFLAAESASVRLTPGSLARVSFQVKVPLALTAGADGLVVYDSAGGEALGVRITGPVPQWKKYTLYRQVPANGELRVVIALTSLGVAVVDDVRIEPLVTK